MMNPNENESADNVIEEFAPELVNSAVILNILYQLDNNLRVMADNAIQLGNNAEEKLDDPEGIQADNVLNFANALMHAVHTMKECLDIVDMLAGKPAMEFAKENGRELQERLRDTAMATDEWQRVERALTESSEQFVARKELEVALVKLSGMFNAPTD